MKHHHKHASVPFAGDDQFKQQLYLIHQNNERKRNSWIKILFLLLVVGGIIGISIVLSTDTVVNVIPDKTCKDVYCPYNSSCSINTNGNVECNCQKANYDPVTNCTKCKVGYQLVDGNCTNLDPAAVCGTNFKPQTVNGEIRCVCSRPFFTGNDCNQCATFFTLSEDKTRCISPAEGSNVTATVVTIFFGALVVFSMIAVAVKQRIETIDNLYVAILAGAGFLGSIILLSIANSSWLGVPVDSKEYVAWQYNASLWAGVSLLCVSYILFMFYRHCKGLSAEVFSKIVWKKTDEIDEDLKALYDELTPSENKQGEFDQIKEQVRAQREPAPNAAP